MVVYPGRDPRAKAVLMLAHIDVVEAKRQDWTRDPFTLVEENGYFYARGAADDKAMASIWVDTLAPLSAREIPASQDAQTRPDLRRGDQRRVQWRPISRH